MFNIFKKKKVEKAVLPAKHKLRLEVYYASSANPKSEHGMGREIEVSSGEEYGKVKALYEKELNDGLKRLNEAKDDEFVNILNAVFQKKYLVSFTLSDIKNKS